MAWAAEVQANCQVALIGGGSGKEPNEPAWKLELTHERGLRVDPPISDVSETDSPGNLRLKDCAKVGLPTVARGRL